MFKVTADIFSGRPNPSWIVDGSTTADLLKKMAQPRVSGALDDGFLGLGNRGLVVDLLDDHQGADHDLPASFRLTSDSHALDVAERLLAAATETSAAHPAIAEMSGASAPVSLDDELKKYILHTLPGRNGGSGALTTHALTESPPTGPAAACAFETTVFNPGFWNDPAHIAKNNCYNYASNRRTDTFAQPGRASGHMYSAINCAQVTNGAVSDGATLACAPDSQKPRWYMALVIAPGPGFIDYHWYREATGGFWGHKPGQTPARNTDNSGRVITDPRTANRGPYTIFCGFMYAQAKMVVK